MLVLALAQVVILMLGGMQIEGLHATRSCNDMLVNVSCMASRQAEVWDGRVHEP